jgi:GMP synthase (glutamine-hydrolysing) A subunit
MSLITPKTHSVISKTAGKKITLSPHNNEKVIIIDFGSQYTQVIARRVRECHVFSEILPYSTKASLLAKDPTIRGIILSGGPASVYTKKAPSLDSAIYELGIPILGICYGMQLIARDLGGTVARSESREYGSGQLTLKGTTPLFKKIKKKFTVWNSHSDRIEKLPHGFSVFGHTENSPHAVIGDLKRNIYGLQFHPEATTDLVQAWLDIGGANYLPSGMTTELLMANLESISNESAQNCEILVDWFISEYVAAQRS